MAKMDKFMIAPINSGMQTDQKPWLIPDDAFESLTDCYVFRGRVRKRFGSELLNQTVDPSLQQLYSRLRINVKNADDTFTTDGTGAASGTVPGLTYAVGQMFSIGPDIFTVDVTGTPATLLYAPGSLGETDGTGNASGTVTGAGGSVGMVFSIDGFTYTVAAPGLAALTPGIGAPGSGTFNTATGAFTFTSVTSFSQIYFLTGVTATYNTTSGAYSFTSSYFNTAVFFYPATPVMGFVTYENDQLNDEPVFAFDTQFVYKYTAGGWARIASEATPGASVWIGNDSQFFWGYTDRGGLNSDYFMYVTNFNPPDYQRYFDGSNWNFLYPIVNGLSRLVSSRLIIPFKDRLICLNTVERNEGTQIGTTDGSGNFSFTINPYVYTPGQAFLVGTTVYTVLTSTTGPMGVSVINTQVTAPTATFTIVTGPPKTGTIAITGNNNNPNTPVFYLDNLSGVSLNYVNRCRYSQNGSPVNSNAWVETIPGRGNYLDAPTKEQIISAEFLKDRLIVYFESSTWELAYTGNEILPFRWQQINTELGAESTFSTVPFDKVVLGIGNVGIHACNGSNVERIDNKIPDEVFKFQNGTEGVFRVWGIRDYYVEQVYWTFPSDAESATYPNRILVYNYKTGSWAFNIDTITAFGYFQQQDNVTWSSSTEQWQEAMFPWDSGVEQSHFKQVLAGNQEGFTFLILPDITRNAPSLQITNISGPDGNGNVLITAINHNLVAGTDYVVVEEAQGVLNINGGIYQVEIINDVNSFYINQPLMTGTYTGGGTLARVSNIDIKTKQYNFYVQQGLNAYINKVDFYVDKTTDGQITVDYSVSSSNESLLTEGAGEGCLLGNGVLETSPYALMPQENSQVRLWHPIYPFAQGEVIQLHLYFTPDQITNPNIAWSDFQMHAMTFYTSPTGRLQ